MKVLLFLRRRVTKPCSFVEDLWPASEQLLPECLDTHPDSRLRANSPSCRRAHHRISRFSWCSSSVPAHGGGQKGLRIRLFWKPLAHFLVPRTKPGERVVSCRRSLLRNPTVSTMNRSAPSTMESGTPDGATPSPRKRQTQRAMSFERPAFSGLHQAGIPKVKVNPWIRDFRTFW